MSSLRVTAKALITITALAVSTPAFAQSSEILNDYPTIARADYIFGCMAANGQTRDVLEKCACSIDLVATILPYDKYVEAETILSVGRVGGEKVAVFNTSQSLQNIVADLRRAQVEAEFRCF